MARLGWTMDKCRKMNTYRELSKYEEKALKDIIKQEDNFYNLKYFIEEIIREHYLEGYQDKEREILENLKTLITSGFVEKGTIL